MENWCVVPEGWTLKHRTTASVCESLEADTIRMQFLGTFGPNTVLFQICIWNAIHPLSLEQNGNGYGKPRWSENASFSCGCCCNDDYLQMIDFSTEGGGLIVCQLCSSTQEHTLHMIAKCSNEKMLQLKSCVYNYHFFPYFYISYIHNRFFFLR